jgi:hypothetical protein
MAFNKMHKEIETFESLYLSECDGGILLNY